MFETSRGNGVYSFSCHRVVISIGLFFSLANRVINSSTKIPFSSFLSWLFLYSEDIDSSLKHVLILLSCSCKKTSSSTIVFHMIVLHWVFQPTHPMHSDVTRRICAERFPEINCSNYTCQTVFSSLRIFKTDAFKFHLFNVLLEKSVVMIKISQNENRK